MVFKKLKQDKLKVSIYKNRGDMGLAAARKASARIRKCIRQKGVANVVFAAAPSQSETLKYLVADKRIDWGKVCALHMDEYVGLKKGDSRTFGAFLDRELFSKAPFRKVFYISDGGETPEQLGAAYTKILRQNPPDVVCLGIGENGHIAFNDPHTADFKDSQTVKTVDLDAVCRMQQVNDGCFESIDQVPEYAVTLTVPAIVSAKSLICTVPGAAKANAVFETLKGAIGEACPATAMRLHADAHMFTDTFSASKIL